MADATVTPQLADFIGNEAAQSLLTVSIAGALRDIGFDSGLAAAGEWVVTDCELGEIGYDTFELAATTGGAKASPLLGELSAQGLALTPQSGNVVAAKGADAGFNGATAAILAGITLKPQLAALSFDAGKAAPIGPGLVTAIPGDIGADAGR